MVGDFARCLQKGLEVASIFKPHQLKRFFAARFPFPENTRLQRFNEGFITQ
jgi:hypothetical protein